MGEEVLALSYHPAMESYIVATSIKVDWKLPEDDELRDEWRYDGLSSIVIDEFILVLTYSVNRRASTQA